MYSLTGFYQLKGSLLYADPDSGIRNRYFRQRYLYLPFKPPRRAIVEAAVIKNGPQGLRADEKPVFEFLRNTDYRHFNALFRRLPAQCIAWHNQMSAIQNISTLRIPVIFVHSKRDVLVPYYETVKLYNSYPGPKQVFLLNLLEHVDPLKFGNSFMESIRGIAQYYRFLFALLSI
jgi:pimeloyl-ACP methyl ester carboxylesterase